MRLSPSLRKTLKLIQGDISGIRASIAALIAPRPDIQELARSISDSNEAEQLQRDHVNDRLLSLRTKEQARKTSERYARRYQPKNYKVQVWLAIGTWLAFAAAAIYAGFAWRTMKEIQRQTRAVECASVAATESVHVAAAGLQQNQRQFDDTLKQMQAQTAEQGEAASAALQSANTAKEALHVSERAYLVRGKVETDLEHKVLTVNIENVGHIPTGDIHVVGHLAVVEQVPFAPEGLVRILEASRIESDMPSFPPGAPQPIKLTSKSWDPDLYKMGIQGLAIVLTLTYNDGFPDEPDRTLKICTKSAYHPQIHMTDFIACNAKTTLEKLAKWEADPKVQHQPQPPRSD